MCVVVVVVVVVVVAVEWGVDAVVFPPLPVTFFFAEALASMCKLAILSSVLCSNSYLSLAFVSPKVSFTFLTIGDERQRLGWVEDESERQTRGVGPPGG